MKLKVVQFNHKLLLWKTVIPNLLYKIADYFKHIWSELIGSIVSSIIFEWEALLRNKRYPDDLVIIDHEKSAQPKTCAGQEDLLENQNYKEEDTADGQNFLFLWPHQKCDPAACSKCQQQLTSPDPPETFTLNLRVSLEFIELCFLFLLTHPDTFFYF